MTSHELAKKLLELPDLPIGLPAVKTWDDADEFLYTPVIEKVTGEDPNTDKALPVLVLSYSSCEGHRERPRPKEECSERSDWPQ